MKKLFFKEKKAYGTYYYFFNHRLVVDITDKSPWGDEKSAAITFGRTFKKGNHFRITLHSWTTKTDEPPF